MGCTRTRKRPAAGCERLRGLYDMRVSIYTLLGGARVRLRYARHLDATTPLEAGLEPSQF